MSYFFLQDFQKDILRAGEAFTAIGYKQIETGENLFLLSPIIISWQHSFHNLENYAFRFKHLIQININCHMCLFFTICMVIRNEVV